MARSVRSALAWVLVALARRLARAWPSEARLYHELAVAARDAGRHDEAMRAEQASLVLDAPHAAAQHGLSLLLADAVRYRDASRALLAQVERP